LQSTERITTMAKDPLIDWLTRLGQWAEELSKTITDATPPEPPKSEKSEPARGPWHPGYEATLRAASRQRLDLERMIERSRSKLQRALERYHGAESRPTADVPFDQLIETVVRTIDGEIGPNKGFPKQVTPPNDAQVDSLRSLVRDMEVLSDKIQRIQAGEGQG
jgi:hypothetical protein